MQWRKGLSSSAQPSAEWLKKVRDNGYEVVVNLAPPQVQGSIREEGGLVGATGATYVNIPVDFSKPTAEDFRFLIHENADVAEEWKKVTTIWTPEGTWRRFIDETLRANGKQAELF